MVDRFFVTKVTVTYKELHFRYAFKVLQMGDVPEEVKQAYKHNRKAIHNMQHNQPDASNTFGGFPVRLTDAELAEASKQLNLQNPLQQLSSVTSIILKDPVSMKIYKYNSDKAHTAFHIKLVVLQNLQDKGMLPSIPVELVLPERSQRLFSLEFQVIPMKLPPLSYEEALQCLGCLVKWPKASCCAQAAQEPDSRWELQQSHGWPFLWESSVQDPLQHWWWEGMYVELCKMCYSWWKQTVPQPPLHPIPISRPFEIMGVDIMELPNTRCGNSMW